MSSVSRLRRDGVQPDFEFTEEHAVGSMPASLDHASRQRRRRHVPSAPESLVAAAHETSLAVSLTPLGPYQETYRHLSLMLEGYPSLRGSVIASTEELACLVPVQSYLKRTLCVHPEEREWISLEHLIRDVTSVPALRNASPAVVACAVVEVNLQDNKTWRAMNMTKLDLWRVKACFWDFISPSSVFAPKRTGDLHIHLADAVRHINLGPVVAHGYLHLLPIVEGYLALLQTSRSTISKEARDGLETVFLVKANLVQLQHAVLSDVLDGIGFPALTERPPPVNWSSDLSAAAHPSANQRVDRRLFEAVASIAERYCWMFVAAHHLAFPSVPVPSLPLSWGTAMIQWPECFTS